MREFEGILVQGDVVFMEWTQQRRKFIYAWRHTIKYGIQEDLLFSFAQIEMDKKHFSWWLCFLFSSSFHLFHVYIFCRKLCVSPWDEIEFFVSSTSQKHSSFQFINNFDISAVSHSSLTFLVTAQMLYKLNLFTQQKRDTFFCCFLFVEDEESGKMRSRKLIFAKQINITHSKKKFIWVIRKRQKTSLCPRT